MRALVIFAIGAVACGRIDFDPLAGKVADATMIPIDTPADTVFAQCAGNAGTTTPILIDTGTSKFCIDRTEVTNAQYAAFLATNPSTNGQPTFCAFNNDYTPSAISMRWPIVTGVSENLPVGSMDWCDARAYCAWAGKRLCGMIGGGPVPGAVRGDPTQSEWMYACTGGGAVDFFGYPYGETYSMGTCVDVDYAGIRPENVGGAINCQGGFPGLFDMAGNITEWEDSCDTNNMGASDMCSYRGGEYGHSPMATYCGVQEGFMRGDSGQPSGGFRCCSDAL